MKLDLSKLSDAVAKVAGVAQAHASVSAQHSALNDDYAALVADLHSSQDAVDHLTASLLAAIDSPAEAVGISAVAAAVHPDALAQDPAIAPHVAEQPTATVLPSVSPVAPEAPLDPIAAAIAAAHAAVPR